MHHKPLWFMLVASIPHPIPPYIRHMRFDQSPPFSSPVDGIAEALGDLWAVIRGFASKNAVLSMGLVMFLFLVAGLIHLGALSSSTAVLDAALGSFLAYNGLVVRRGVLRHFKRWTNALTRGNIAWVCAWFYSILLCAARQMKADLRSLALPRLLASVRKAASLPLHHIGHRPIAHPCLLRRLVPAPISRA